MSHSTTSRSTLHWLGIFALAATGLGLAGCGGGGQERDLISRFFSASRMGDRTTTGNIAMVAFDPDDDGSVANIDVTNVTEEQRRPLRMRELADAVAQAQADEQDHDAQMKMFQDENFDAIARVIEAERAGESVASRDEEVQSAWSTWREETQVRARNVSDAQNTLLEESQLAEVSAFDPSNPIDVQQFDGELVSKEVTITATVTMGDSSEDRTMVVTLQKVELGTGDDMIDGRWIITDIN